MKTLLIIFLFIIVDLLPANDWQEINKMPEPVYGGQAVILDNYIYVLGGFSDSLGRPVSTIQVYEPAVNQWKMTGRMHHARYGFVADKLSDSSIVYCGGLRSNSSDVFSIESWNPVSDGIANGVIDDYNSNFNRTFFTGHVYRNYLYLFGGLSIPTSIDSVSQPFIIRYNLGDRNTTSFQENLYEGTSLPYHHMSVRIDSMVYLLGGVHFNVTNRVSLFNLVSHKLEHTGNLSGVRAGGTAVPALGNIYIIGGYNESARALNTVEIYSPRSNIVFDKSRMNNARKEPMAVAFKGSIYVFGGKDQFDITVSAVEKLDLVSSSQSPVVAMPKRSQLHDNYPNPFNATTTIGFDTYRLGKVTLEIYALNGRLIKSLFSGIVPAGTHQFMWHGTDNENRTVSSGVYFYRLVSGADILTRKLVLVK